MAKHADSHAQRTQIHTLIQCTYAHKHSHIQLQTHTRTTSRHHSDTCYYTCTCPYTQERTATHTHTHTHISGGTCPTQVLQDWSYKSHAPKLCDNTRRPSSWAPRFCNCYPGSGGSRNSQESCQLINQVSEGASFCTSFSRCCDWFQVSLESWQARHDLGANAQPVTTST